MQKVFDNDLEEQIADIIDAYEESTDAAAEIVAALKKIQDAGGMKVCQAK